MGKTLYRLPDQAKLAGVAAGVAEYFEMDVTLVRLIMVLLAFITNGFMVVLYIIMALVLPVPQKGKKAAAISGQSVSDNIKTLSAEIHERGTVVRLKNYFGIAIVVLGLWLLIGQIVPELLEVSWRFIWPVALIVCGMLIISRKGDA